MQYREASIADFDAKIAECVSPIIKNKIMNTSENTLFAKKIMNFPGPSAVGRDFMLEKLLENKKSLEAVQKRSINLKIATKTTDRVARSVELTKKSIPEEHFTKLEQEGKIFAPYVLESNGKRYGYEPDAFHGGEDDILLADASVYQTLALKEKLGDALYSVAVVGSREYREKNIRDRIKSGKSSESEAEIQTRLNLGDAHVALLALMAKEPFHGLVDNDFHKAVDRFMSSKGKDHTARSFIKEFCGSDNVLQILENIIEKAIKAVDEFFVRGVEDHLPKGMEFDGSNLQRKLHSFFGNALKPAPLTA